MNRAEVEDLVGRLRREAPYLRMDGYAYVPEDMEDAAQMGEQLKEAMTALEEIVVLDQYPDALPGAPEGPCATVARRILSRWEAP